MLFCYGGIPLVKRGRASYFAVIPQFIMKPEQIYIIDAHGFLHKNFHALPRLTTSRGEEVGALYGFARMLLKLIREKTPGYVAVCFDSPGKNFRHSLYGEYKANRKETDEALKSQLSLARDLAKSLGLRIAAAEGFEADDLIATVCEEFKGKDLTIQIISSDKDLMQLISDQVMMIDTMKDREIKEPQVKEKFGVDYNPNGRITSGFWWDLPKDHWIWSQLDCKLPKE